MDMEDKIKLEIVTPEKIVYTDRVDEVIIPGEEGEFGVMPNHTPFLSSLRIGVVTIYQDGKQQHLVTGKGFVEVTGKKVILLTQKALTADEIDANLAEQEQKELGDKLNEMTQEDPDFDEIKDNYDIAVYKLKVSAS